jgi:predicted regulator of Ras-like GTPase activity (Roadblock/LC7/MglB family)
MFPGVRGDQALSELLDVSEDVVAAVILDGQGEPIAASVGSDEARSAAEIAAAMLAYADALRTEATSSRLKATTAQGSVFVVREGDRAIVAATGTDPVAGLVLHDLRTALKNAGRRTRERANASS